MLECPGALGGPSVEAVISKLCRSAVWAFYSPFIWVIWLIENKKSLGRLPRLLSRHSGEKVEGLIND